MVDGRICVELSEVLIMGKFQVGRKRSFGFDSEFRGLLLELNSV
jgi:hypothetical protein